MAIAESRVFRDERGVLYIEIAGDPNCSAVRKVRDGDEANHPALFAAYRAQFEPAGWETGLATPVDGIPLGADPAAEVVPEPAEAPDAATETLNSGAF